MPPLIDEIAHSHPRAVVLRWRVPDGVGAVRADLHLCDKVGRLSRSRAQRIIRRGDFRRPGGVLKPASRLLAGEEVELWRIPPDDEEITDPPTVLFENEHFVALNKPGTLAVHPSARYLYQTVTHWLRLNVPGAHPCHRLDRETSGVLLCAKTKVGERAAKGWFRNGQMTKRYLAVVRGHLSTAAQIEVPLALQGERGLVRIRMIRDPEGLSSITDVEPVHYDSASGRTLVACFPKTGRQHQIRAHLFEHGFPIVGDKLYAMGDVFFDAWTRSDVDEAEALECERQALHAHRLTPPTNDLGLSEVCAPTPKMFDALLT